MKVLFVILLIILSFLLRVWHGEQFFFWHIDEEILSQTAKRILIDHRPQLIGFPIPGGIYLGPLIYYIVSFFYFLAFMNPANLPFFSAFIAGITVFFVYLVGKTPCDHKVKVAYF